MRRWSVMTPRDDQRCVALYVICDLAAPRLQLSDERLCLLRRAIGSPNLQLAVAMTNLTSHGRAALVGTALGSPSGDLWITAERLRRVFVRLLLAMAGRSVEDAVAKIKRPDNEPPWVTGAPGGPQQRRQLLHLRLEIRRCSILLRDTLANDGERQTETSASSAQAAPASGSRPRNERRTRSNS